MTDAQLEEWHAGREARVSPEEWANLEHGLQSCSPPLSRGPSRIETIRHAKLHEEIELGIRWRDEAALKQREAEENRQAALLARHIVAALRRPKPERDAPSPGEKGTPGWGVKGKNAKSALDKLAADGRLEKLTPGKVVKEVEKLLIAAGCEIPQDLTKLIWRIRSGRR